MKMNRHQVYLKRGVHDPDLAEIHPLLIPSPHVVPHQDEGANRHQEQHANYHHGRCDVRVFAAAARPSERVEKMAGGARRAVYRGLRRGLGGGVITNYYHVQVNNYQLTRG